MSRTAIAVAIGLALGRIALAQEPAPPPETSKEISEKRSTSNPPPESYQQGSWLEWSKMTGDWGGARTALAEKGITIDFDVHQITQGNAHGGASTKNGFRYSGTSDITIRLDTCKMGLWEGGTFLIHAEPKWGNGINPKVGSLLPVNFDAYKPNLDKCAMALSEWIYFQDLFDKKLTLIAGKLDGSRAFDRNAFANDERTQFMNLGLRNYPNIGSFLPYTTLGVGAILNPLDWLSIATSVADARGSATEVGFETAFHSPSHTSVIHEWDFKLKPFDKEGNYRVGFIWSNKDAQHLRPVTPFSQTGPLLTKVLGQETMGKIAPLLPYKTSPDNVAIYTNFDQFVWNDACDPERGVGVFGRFGWAPQEVNPITHFYSAGVGGRGLIKSRKCDTMGVGYFYEDLSNKLPSYITDEQGIETYYNIQIAPWLHITPDFQVVIKPGGSEAHDVAIVYGLRFVANL
jgi:porin